MLFFSESFIYCAINQLLPFKIKNKANGILAQILLGIEIFSKNIQLYLILILNK